MAIPEGDYRDCRDEAIRAGALQPQGFRETTAAKWLSSQGQSFADTPLAQSRLEAWTKDCLSRKGQRG